MGRNSSRGLLFVLLTAVVISSGCIENSSTDLNSDFSLDVNTTSVNGSGMDVYRASMSQASNVSNYSVEADNMMAMNLPGVGVSVNMTSEGVFNAISKINTTGILGFNFAGNSNTTEFTTQIRSSKNGSETFTKIMDRENRTEGDSYSREELGISLEALNGIEVENASVLGISNLNGEENILLDLDVNGSDLMRNSEQIFELHSPVKESTDNGQGMESAASFNESKAYLWTGREDKLPSKFAYYGSADNGTIQVRSITEYW